MELEESRACVLRSFQNEIVNLLIAMRDVLCCFVSFWILDGRYQQGLPQLSDPGVLVAVSERDVAHLATPEPPDWLGARQVLPGKVAHV